MDIGARITLGLTTATAAILLAGCGGGGTTDPGPAPATKLHLYTAGDQWQYTFSGQESIGGQNLAISGTESRTVSQATLNGQSVLAMTITDNIEVNNQHLTETTTSYVKQDPTTGNVTLLADTQGTNGTVRTVTTQETTQQGTFASGQTTSSTVTFSNGETLTSSQSIQGHTFVTVPAGSFNTWHTINEKHDSNGISSSDIEWWAPDLGAFVKANVTGAEPGFSINFTLSLTSTTVTG